MSSLDDSLQAQDIDMIIKKGEDYFGYLESLEKTDKSVKNYLILGG
jgi:hypothetical protein